MKNRTKVLPLVFALAMCLSLMACGAIEDPYLPDDDIGGDWRVTGVVRDSGTITRDGEDTYVFVCVHKADATFYYDSEDQVLFGYVEYPITFGDNVWDIFRGTDFSDLNGDGNGDVTMKFDDGGTEIKIVWFWDSESDEFVYQPDHSNIPA